MPPTMLFRRDFVLLSFLLPALAAPDYVLPVEVSGDRPDNEAAEDPSTSPKGSEDTSDGGDEPQHDDSCPRGRLAPQPAPVEQLQRVLRVPWLCKLAPRLPEKGLARAPCPIPRVPRVERVVAQERCVTTSLSVVASTIQGHAPPRGSLIL